MSLYDYYSDCLCDGCLIAASLGNIVQVAVAAAAPAVGQSVENQPDEPRETQPMQDAPGDFYNKRSIDDVNDADQGSLRKKIKTDDGTEADHGEVGNAEEGENLKSRMNSLTKQILRKICQP